MSLNTTTTSITSGTVSLTLFGIPLNPTFNGTCTVTADATGTLVLPAKTFTDAIRVNTSQLISANGATVNLVYYDYYSPSLSKAPIYSIQSATINATGQPTSNQKITTVLNNWELVNVKENEKENSEINVFPNPATNLVNFTTANLNANKVSVMDINGKIIFTEIIENGKAKINTSNFSAGIYIYQITDKTVS